VSCSAECRRRPGDTLRLFGTGGLEEGAVWRVPLSADEGTVCPITLNEATGISKLICSGGIQVQARVNVPICSRVTFSDCNLLWLEVIPINPVTNPNPTSL
jgi:hypothetical protein